MGPFRLGLLVLYKIVCLECSSLKIIVSSQTLTVSWKLGATRPEEPFWLVSKSRRLTQRPWEHGAETSKAVAERSGKLQDIDFTITPDIYLWEWLTLSAHFRKHNTHTHTLGLFNCYWCNVGCQLCHIVFTCSMGYHLRAEAVFIFSVCVCVCVDLCMHARITCTMTLAYTESCFFLSPLQGLSQETHLWPNLALHTVLIF